MINEVQTVKGSRGWRALQEVLIAPLIYSSTAPQNGGGGGSTAWVPLQGWGVEKGGRRRCPESFQEVLVLSPEVHQSLWGIRGQLRSRAGLIRFVIKDTRSIEEEAMSSFICSRRHFLVYCHAVSVDFN